MKNADMPAMPIELNGFGQYAPEAHTGLTKREMIAMNIMAGLMTSYHKVDYSCEQNARVAVAATNALLKELDQ